MPAPRQFTLTGNANGVLGGPYWIDARGATVITIHVSTLGGTSVDVRPVGTASPAAATNTPSTSSPGFEALSFRTSGNAAYGSTAVTVNAGSAETFHLDPSDYMPFVGLQLSGMSGTVAVTATVYMS